ncbi:MAG: VWA-like domain-containing protein [Acidobacteriales bacterium]|nr:VWA-like domain-containing protein [Terriglobales bacterium]
MRSKGKSDVVRQAEEKLQAATAQLVVSHGFFAGAVLQMRWIACEDGKVDRMDLARMGTDGRDLYYNPHWVAQAPPEHVKFGLAHEACHILGLHPFRRGMREMDLWPIACDFIVNDVCQEAGMPIPPNSLPPVADSTPEAEYEKLQKLKKQTQQAHKGNCGCAIVDPKGEHGEALTGAELAAAEAEAKLRAATVAEIAKRAGNLPGKLARLVGAALEERVPWERIVSRFVTQNAKVESAWRKPNRRYLTRGIMLPSLWTPEVPDFVMACDTSGSIDTETLRTICGEVLHALSTVEQKGGTGGLLVVWCDTEVSAQRVESQRDLEPKGGGGTMFSPAFAYVNENAPHTKGVVYVTDGYCSDFGPEPEYNVLWVLTAHNELFRPPFGEIAFVI